MNGRPERGSGPPPEALPEPWLRGTLGEVPAVARAVLHALELAGEDVLKHCGGLSAEEMNATPHGLAPVAFHLRHLAGSLDRLLTYAEGRQLNGEQRAALRAEFEVGASTEELLAEVAAALASSAERIRRLDLATLEEPRSVGRKRLPTTVAGLLVHVADHTQRHVGQAVTTAKVVRESGGE